jgi:hypothetical protein
MWAPAVNAPRRPGPVAGGVALVTDTRLAHADLAAARAAAKWHRSASDRRFELFRTPWQEQRQDRVAEQSSLRNIGACDPEIGQRHLKSGTVPQRDRHRFVLRQAVVCGHARR